MKDGRRLTKTGAIITIASWLPMLVKKQRWKNYLSCRFDFYATGHGPLVRYALLNLLELTGNGGLSQTAQDTGAAYGNTATLAQAIARGITKAGVGVESINCEFAEPAEIQAAVEKSAGFVIHLHSVVMRPPKLLWALCYLPLPTTNSLGCLVPMAEVGSD